MLNENNEDILKKSTQVGGVDEGYVYYLSAAGKSPYSYDIEKYGNNGDALPDENGNVMEGSFLFYAIKPYSIDNNYILYNPNDDEVNELKKLGFECKYAGNYLVAVHEGDS